VKKDDHLMDCVRGAVTSGRERMKTAPGKKDGDLSIIDAQQMSTSWMA